jgi:glycosyltransferase involved in cell wall biosynthesis
MESFGIAEKLRRSAKGSTGGALKNSYTIIDGDAANPIDPRTVETLGFGFDYYMEVFRVLESSHDISGLDFFISIRCPDLLPRYGKSVVLFVLCDPWYLFRPYFYRIGGVFKCHTIRPQLVGTGSDPQQFLSTVVQYALRSISHFRSRLRSRILTLGTSEARARVYSLPLGYFFNPGPPSTEIRDREVGFSFAGSVEYIANDGFNLRRLLAPAKLISRRKMAAALETYLTRHPNSGMVKKTSHFMESISHREEYLNLLKRSKVVVCPRGEISETYRFFEAAACGCAIICEPLPLAWYYEGQPAVIVNDWRKLDTVLDELLTNDAKLTEIARRTAEYWRDLVSEAAIARYIVAQLSVS